MTIEKAVLNKIRKWNSFDMDLFLIHNYLSQCYNKISLGDYDDKKKIFYFITLFKNKKDYIYLKIYHNEIKKNLYNEKLLNYFESILVANGFNLN